jgi:hypothetical protein
MVQPVLESDLSATETMKASSSALVVSGMDQVFLIVDRAFLVGENRDQHSKISARGVGMHCPHWETCTRQALLLCGHCLGGQR